MKIHYRAGTRDKNTKGEYWSRDSDNQDSVTVNFANHLIPYSYIVHELGASTCIIL